MNKYLVEFIGTFFLILTIVLTVNTGAGELGLAPIAIGSILMVMIYAGGHISGAHYNPAVTLGVFLRGKCSAGDVAPYMIAQIAGGALAALTATFLLGEKAPSEAPAALDVVPSLIAEILGTFALVWVILHTATTKSNAGNSHYGLAIGFTVLACAYSLGWISGGAFNPAVAVGVSVAGMSGWADIWIFLVANFAGGALAAVLFKVVYGNED